MDILSHMGSATDVVEMQLRLFSMRHNIFPRFRCASNGHHETPRQIIFDCLDMPVAGQFFRRTWFHSGWTLDVPGSWFVGMWSHYCWNLRLVDVLGLWRGFCATLVNRSGNGDDPLVDVSSAGASLLASQSACSGTYRIFTPGFPPFDLDHLTGL